MIVPYRILRGRNRNVATSLIVSGSWLPELFCRASIHRCYKVEIDLTHSADRLGGGDLAGPGLRSLVESPLYSSSPSEVGGYRSDRHASRGCGRVRPFVSMRTEV